MMFRNRFTQQLIHTYRNDHEKYTKKQIAKKNRYVVETPKVKNNLKDKITIFTTKQSGVKNQV